MLSIEEAIPLWVGIVFGLLLSVIVWSGLQARRPTAGDAAVDMQGHVRLGLLLVAVFGTGVFITYPNPPNNISVAFGGLG